MIYVRYEVEYWTLNSITNKKNHLRTHINNRIDVVPITSPENYLNYTDQRDEKGEGSATVFFRF